MLDRRELLECFDLMRARFYEERAARVFRGWTRTMQYHFTDVDQYWYLRVVNGRPGEPSEGKIDTSEVFYQMSTDTFASIARRETTGMKAYMQGKVKVKGSMSDLMKLQKLD